MLEHVIIELLNLAGMPAEFGQTREISSAACTAWCSAAPKAVARVALEYGHKLLMAAINDEPFDLPAVHAIKTAINDRYLGPSTGCIVDAASERRIPHIRLNDGNLVQLGYGAAQRRIWTAESDQTSAIAEGIAQDKDFTKRLLAPAACPCPKARSWHRRRGLGSGAGHRLSRPSSPRTATMPVA
jgi:cyanophycin synthetase